jgi:hypothetical protein
MQSVMAMMRLVLWTALLAAGLAAQEAQPVALNVNSRYVVESVEVTNRKPEQFSKELKRVIGEQVGQLLDQAKLDEIRVRLERENGDFSVRQKLVKGSEPEKVRVVFELTRRRWVPVDFRLPRMVYSSKQNFSFGVDIDKTIGGNKLNFGLQTDNDTLLERYSGIRAGFRRPLLNNRIQAGIIFESYRAQWNGATLAAAAPEEIYRTRLNVQPLVAVRISEPVTLTVGASVQRYEMQFPAARDESANLVYTTLRYVDQRESASGQRHRVDAAYTLRAATSSFASDFHFTRQQGHARYGLRDGDQGLAVEVGGGILNGEAPLAERFLLGNSTTLRGWNKIDLAAAGGDRMVHASAEYTFAWMRVVYDTGTVWRDGDGKTLRHSVAIGFAKEGITALVAFPIRAGSITPIFLLGYSF